MKRYHTVGLLLLLFALVALPACSSGGSATATSISVKADSFKFTPSSFKAAADTDVEVTVTNANDTDEHEWVIVKPGHELTSEADFDEEDVLFEVEAVPPGTSESGTFNVPAGTYQIICALEGHFDGGMVGELVVSNG